MTATRAAARDKRDATPLLVTVMKASIMLCLTPWDTAKLCYSGKLKSGLVGERRLISVESVRTFAEQVIKSDHDFDEVAEVVCPSCCTVDHHSPKVRPILPRPVP